MAEICRKPISLSLNGVEFTAFDEDHTISDIARWLIVNRADCEELHRVLGEMLEQDTGG